MIRLPIFTGFPSDQEKLSKPDSILLSDILRFSLIIKQDSFFLAQIAQININPNGDFEMIPALGDHTVLFGTVENMEDKLNRLYTFYKKVWPSTGINAYQVLDLRFDHQLLALKKGMQPIEYPPGALPDLQPLNMLDSVTVIDTVQTKVVNAINIPKTKVDSMVNTKLKTTPALNQTPTSSKKEIPKVVKKVNNKPNIKSKPKLEKNAKKLNNKSTNNTLKQEKKSAKAEMPKKTTSNNN